MFEDCTEYGIPITINNLTIIINAGICRAKIVKELFPIYLNILKCPTITEILNQKKIPKNAPL